MNPFENDLALLPTLFFAFVLGLKHSIETDHVVALSTLAAREKSWSRSMLLGAVWGAGHSLTLLVMGMLIIVFRWEMPPALTPVLESAVAAMLVFLGVRALWLCVTGQGHVCRHQHDGVDHVHFHRFGEHVAHDDVSLEHASTHSSTRSSLGAAAPGHRQSFLVGMVHGLAGSGALMLLVLSTVPQPLWGLGYIALFGLGLMGGMCVISAVFSFSLALAQRRFLSLGRIAGGVAGTASLGFGLYLAWGIGLEMFFK